MSEKKSIAIIGIGCRLPGNADSPDALWKNLVNKVDSITEIPKDRWDLQSFYHPNFETPKMSYSKWGGFVDNVEAFDPAFFGITPREAKQMDPQQRFMLEVTHNAFRDAGYNPAQFKKKSVGVFVGVSTFDYATRNFNHLNAEDIDTYGATGGSLSIVANRISYIFDFWGPSFIVDTACSSSLLSFHLACESVQKGESKLAIAGGVNMILDPGNHVAFAKMGLLSPHGRCKAFSAEAAGFVRGEGAGAVLLKPLDEALKDRDRIYAVVRATGTNQDGKTNGIAVPNQESQEALYHKVYSGANIDPAKIDYVEAHGTGTIVGDQAEAGSIGKIIGNANGRKRPCYIGSIKTNIGHLESGSGIAGLIKAILVLDHKTVPPNLHFEKPSPHIKFRNLKLKVTTKAKSLSNLNWAEVNSFGFGGANVHVVLERGPRTSKQVGKPIIPSLILPISASDAERLEVAESNHLNWLKETRRDPKEIIHDTLNNHYIYDKRSALIGKSNKEWVDVLEHRLADKEHLGYVQNENDQKVSSIIFVFSGQGPQWFGMGRQLYKENSIFRRWLKKCDDLIQKYAGWSLLKELSRTEEESRINNTAIAQPAITSFQIALAKTLMAYGVYPKGVIGHSIGEIAAGHIAGAYSFETAIKIIVERGAAMADYSRGGQMIAVNIPQNELFQLTHDLKSLEFNVAALNSPINFTLAGSAEAIQALAKKSDELKLFNKKLRVDHAFHSAFMDQVEEPLLRALQSIKVKKPKLQMMSTVKADWITKGSELKAEYWWENVRKPVKFFPAIRKLMEDTDTDTFIEISPHPVLKTSLSYILKTVVEQSYSIIETIYRKQDESFALSKTLASLFVRGYPLHWDKLIPGRRTVASMPEFPYLKKDYWDEAYENKLLKTGQVNNYLLGKRMPGHNIQFKNFVDVHRFPFIKDHRIRGQILFPATAYIETFLGLAKTLHPERKLIQIEDLRFSKALTLKDDSAYVQTHVSFDENLHEASFYSRSLVINVMVV